MLKVRTAANQFFFSHLGRLSFDVLNHSLKANPAIFANSTQAQPLSLRKTFSALFKYASESVLPGPAA